jgi:hypothetical protein
MQFRVLLLALAAAFFSSCSARIEGALLQDGSANLRVDAALEPQMTNLLRVLQAMGNRQAAGAPLLDGPAMARSMASAPGVASVSFNNKGPAAIAGTIAISRIDAFLSAPAQTGETPFITYDPNGRLQFFLDLRSAPQALLLFSPELVGYLSSLMAPIATGVTLSKDEYLMLVSSIYGRPLADEIAAARINAAIDFPGTITAIQGGEFQGSRAQFSIPLIDVLVLEKPLIYEVRWRH